MKLKIKTMDQFTEDIDEFVFDEQEIFHTNLDESQESSSPLQETPKLRRQKGLSAAKRTLEVDGKCDDEVPRKRNVTENGNVKEGRIRNSVWSTRSSSRDIFNSNVVEGKGTLQQSQESPGKVPKIRNQKNRKCDDTKSRKYECNQNVDFIFHMTEEDAGYTEGMNDDRFSVNKPRETDVNYDAEDNYRTKDTCMLDNGATDHCGKSAETEGPVGMQDFLLRRDNETGLASIASSRAPSPQLTDISNYKIKRKKKQSYPASASSSLSQDHSLMESRREIADNTIDPGRFRQSKPYDRKVQLHNKDKRAPKTRDTGPDAEVRYRWAVTRLHTDQVDTNLSYSSLRHRRLVKECMAGIIKGVSMHEAGEEASDSRGQQTSSEEEHSKTAMLRNLYESILESLTMEVEDTDKDNNNHDSSDDMDNDTEAARVFTDTIKRKRSELRTIMDGHKHQTESLLGCHQVELLSYNSSDLDPISYGNLLQQIKVRQNHEMQTLLRRHTRELSKFSLKTSSEIETARDDYLHQVKSKDFNDQVYNVVYATL